MNQNRNNIGSYRPGLSVHWHYALSLEQVGYLRVLFETHTFTPLGNGVYTTLVHVNRLSRVISTGAKDQLALLKGVVQQGFATLVDKRININVRLLDRLALVGPVSSSLRVTDATVGGWPVLILSTIDPGTQVLHRTNTTHDARRALPPSAFHRECAERLWEAVKDLGKGRVNTSLEVWANWFRKLEQRSKVPADKIEQMLDWYVKELPIKYPEENHGYLPVCLSAHAFNKKWNALLRAYDRGFSDRKKRKSDPSNIHFQRAERARATKKDKERRKRVAKEIHEEEAKSLDMDVWED